MAPFIHLHTASAYSLRYGTAFPDALARRAAEHGMDMLALTDRDGLYGAIKHVQACHDRGITPIVGVDLVLRDGHAVSVPGSGKRGGNGEPRRIVVLARSDGWATLCRLVTAAHRLGERGEPYVTPETVAEHAVGTAGIGAGIGGGGSRLTVLLGPRSDVGRAVAERRDDRARALLDAWRSAVPDVVVEVTDLYGYRDVNTATRMLGLAYSMGVPAVLTNDVRYLDAADHQVGNVLDAARRLVPLHPRHVDHPTAHAYLKDGREMARVVLRICGGDLDLAERLLGETRRVAERCALDPVEIVPLLDAENPRLHLPEIGEDPVPLLRRRCEDGLRRRGLSRPGSARTADARGRLAAELAIIEKKRLSGYFITVADITDLIRSMGVRCAIRGSGAGSLVNYLIGIGDVDPLEHGLLMERFLSEGRRGLPDIDVDVESARRLDCYRAILGRYGETGVACVSMMETYRARSAIRDVGAAMGLPPHEIDVIAKAFPHVRAGQIRAALSDLPELRDSGLNDRSLETVFRLAERLDGLPRHIALHPCGVLIGNSTLRDRTPVERSMLDFPMSQFDKDDVEQAGLLKLDVLGVRMQSAMAYSLREIERVDGRKIDLDSVPRDDRDTYDLIRTGRTLGCFQIESPGQRELVAKLEPRTMHDLIVDISLFRPGPVNSDMVTPYLEARHGFREPDYPHEKLREPLRETHGVVVFHEQVLRVVDVMTGCGLSEAEKARRALGTPDGREAVRAWFVPLARGSGFAPDVVERAWRVLDAFGGFGFCKAHAAAFALPTYQSAWLKRHHAAAFFAGVLTHEPGMYPGRVILDEARQCGVDILPLDVNHSGGTWLAERTPATGHSETGHAGIGRGYGLRVPFSAVKGVSEAEVERMAAGQPYTSLADFWERARPSRPITERIVAVGGLDALHGLRPGEPRWRPGELTRRDLIAQVGALDRASGRGTAGQLPMGFTERVVPGELPEMSEAEAVEAELAILGMDVSRHVIGFHDELLDAIGVTRSRDLLRRRNGAEILVAGAKVATQTPAVRSGQRVIFTTLDDSTGPIDLTFFESVQAHTAATVFGSWLLVAKGVVRRTGARAVSLRALSCWNLLDLDRLWRDHGIDAVRAVLSEAPAPPDAAGAGVGGRSIEYANGYRLSPYSDIGPAPGVREGRFLRHPEEPQRRLWHASSGSSGPTPSAR
ncbi:DNA polymerase III subunit alpha [Sphaerimonospora thailandensis]|uniref:DNA-directed DNA polymerase n=1 Tax=Sphaerimonospora thailandensis TaxID=795644 RepID=A0A8J3RG65_9ACTN|nr:DNA polymerase III subunit alpha [Sphaerimonospora thailandensis]GIH71773.1 DNA-directed DNA polymerase [Sphaerimonospora thailandensis]